MYAANCPVWNGLAREVIRAHRESAPPELAVAGPREKNRRAGRARSAFSRRQTSNPSIWALTTSSTTASDEPSAAAASARSIRGHVGLETGANQLFAQQRSAVALHHPQ